MGLRSPCGQVPLLEEGQEKMQRWLQDGEGRLAGLPGRGFWWPQVLLTWPGLQPEAENPRQASDSAAGPWLEKGHRWV